MSEQPPVCDYEGSDYRIRFWDGQGRDYEDQVERVALRRLLPPAGTTLLDVGAGFGRLADEYDGYETVVLLDYSRSLLREAQAHLGDDPRFHFVAANWYQMPFVDGLFASLVQVRTIHHAADAPRLLAELARIARPNADYVLEFANKQNLKAILRYWGGGQSWSPFSPEPIEFAALNYDFHPRWMRQALVTAGFAPGRTLSVSHYRIPLLKRLLPTAWLVALDRLAQPTGRWWQLAPSVFIHSRRQSAGPSAGEGSFFACPACRSSLDKPHDGRLLCPNNDCGLSWLAEDRFYDFKEPLPAATAGDKLT